MPGFPKSATTWLYQCLLSVFNPDTVCRSSLPESWGLPACSRRFLLPLVSTNSLGDSRLMKEPFAFGGTGAPTLVADDGSLKVLHGPDSRAGITTSRLPAMWMWEATHVRSRRARGQAAMYEQRERAQRLAEVCAPREGATHPSCQRVSPGESDHGWACKWDPRLQAQLNLSRGYCLRSLTPWLSPGEANATVIDFTPNYMCDPDAIRRIYKSASAPERIRFVVVVRDPIMRTFSEYAMFRYGYFWETRGNFTALIHPMIDALRRCNASLFRNASALRQLPTAELGAYLAKCFGHGHAMQYVASSAYGACFEHALRWFDRRQFLVLRYEDMIRSSARELVSTLASFVGLDVDERLLRIAAQRGCEPSTPRGHAQSFMARAPAADVELAAMAPALEWLFEPYNALLREQLGERLRWAGNSHRIAPISEAERARRTEALDAIVQKRTARIRRQKEERARRQKEVAEHRRSNRLRNKAMPMGA